MRGLVPRTQMFLKRNSSTILTVIGGLGVITTIALTIRDTPKALQRIEKTREEKGEELTKIETAIAAAPAYIPTVIACGTSLACIFSANILSNRQQAALTSAYAVLDNYHKEYRKTLIDLHGEEIDREVRDNIARSNCQFHQINIDAPDEKMIFYEEISGESIVRYEREIMDAEYHLNRNFVLRGYASLNEFYEFLGLPQTDYGEVVGWSLSDGYCWIDFEHRLVSGQDDAGTPIYSIDMIFPPHADYLEDWM